MRAEEEGLDPSPRLGHDRTQAAMDLFDLLPGGEAAADRRLIGEDDDLTARPAQPGQGLDRAGEELQLLPALDVIGAHAIDHAVAIEQDHRWSLHTIAFMVEAGC